MHVAVLTLVVHAELGVTVRIGTDPAFTISAGRTGDSLDGSAIEGVAHGPSFLPVRIGTTFWSLDSFRGLPPECCCDGVAQPRLRRSRCPVSHKGAVNALFWNETPRRPARFPVQPIPSLRRKASLDGSRPRKSTRRSMPSRVPPASRIARR